ncbi:hypothetical protein CRYUN_Cryun22dG0093000 [Craigia yunnanensis]
MMRMIAGKWYFGDDVSGDEGRQFRDIIKELFELAVSSYSGNFLPILQLVDYNGYIKRIKSLGNKSDEIMQDEIIKGIIQVILNAGSDTTAVTLEWAMSNLLNHPHVLEKARVELDKHVGQEQLVEEADLSRLPYLQNIISETLRLYPAAPRLVPHLASDNCNNGGYAIPKETILMVNAWAIQRDPEL